MTNKSVTEHAENTSTQDETRTKPEQDEQSTTKEGQNNSEQDEQSTDENKNTSAPSGEEEDSEKPAEENEEEGPSRDLLSRVAENVDKAQDILDKIIISVSVARQILDKVEPLLDNKETLKPVHNVLDTVDKRAHTGQNLLNKVAPLVNRQGGVGKALELLDRVSDKLGDLQETLAKTTKGVNFLHVFSGLAGKREEVGMIQTILHKLTRAVEVVQELVHKAKEFLGKPKELSKNITQATKEAVEKVKGADGGPIKKLEALKDTSIIKGVLHPKDKDSKKDETKPESWGIIGKAGHFLLIWSGR